MTIRQAGWWFFGATGVFFAVFIAMTIHSHTQFGELTNADAITEDVLGGKDVWHHKNCVNCHTLMGEGAYYAPDLTEITLHRGTAYLTEFMKEPGRFYSEEEHGRLMTNPELSEEEIRQVLAFLDWIAAIEKYDWPPRPILVSGSALPGGYGPEETAAGAPSDDPVALGERLFRATPPGCFTCHSVAPGVTLAGPTLAGLGARAAEVVEREDYEGDAETAEGYILESILEPSAHITEGPATFAANGRSVMPDNYDETLTSEEIDQLVAYLSSLR
ncbi:MAG: c-type cytochrome [bacterium]